jgi:hypothetical protein
MIPPFAPGGNLPQGIHWATWVELVDRFVWTEHRRRLVAGLRLAIDELAAAGCRAIYVDGSFVSSKNDPGGFDACWETEGVVATLLAPTLIAYDVHRRGQKAKYGGELFAAEAIADLYGTRFVDFFQIDKDTGDPKGIVAIRIGS